MTNPRKNKTASRIILLVSLLFHLGIGLTVMTVEPPKAEEFVSIKMEESAKEEEPDEEKAEEPPPPPPPPPPPERPRERPEAPPVEEANEEPPPEPEPSEPAPAPAELGEEFAGYQDLGGLALEGGGGAGLAVQRAAPPRPRRAQPKPREEAPKRRALAPKVEEDTCKEEPSRPKPVKMVGAEYPERAREAEVEGVVRVTVQINARGEVTGARVARGLGFGLDEAAVAAARQWTFEPAQRCGKPTATSVTLGMRFALGG